MRKFLTLALIMFTGMMYTCSTAGSTAQTVSTANQSEWISLFDGSTLDGWSPSENKSSVKVRDGAILLDGPRSHLFYSGEVENADFKNFEFKADIKTVPGANSGIYFHTEYQEEGWPSKGYEVQIHNTNINTEGYVERKLTGSLYAVRNIFKQMVPDEEWFTMHIIVMGNQIITKLNGQVIVDYVEPENPVRRDNSRGRVLSSGTFALQCHDPESTVELKNIMVKPLPDDLPEDPSNFPVVDETYRTIYDMSVSNFPIIDYHIHTKAGLSLDEALTKSRRTGIMYGIAPNVGLDFPIQSDEQVYEWAESMKGKPVFLGMQAEGREWMELISQDAIAQFDYVFSDALTWTDDQGRRTRLWMPDEVHIDNTEQWMDMYLDRILSVINEEPIDMFVNPTFLPVEIRDLYDSLWTEERIQKFVTALAENNVALEINDRYQIPKLKVLQAARDAGCTFSFGTNNGDANYGNLDYALEMARELDLSPEDMFMPKPDGQKAIQVKAHLLDSN
jgi:hypothetical protein